MNTICFHSVQHRALLFFVLALALALRMDGDTTGVAPLRAKAEEGDSFAQYYLGMAYVEGRAVPKDLVEAYVWLSLAAENRSSGNPLIAVIPEMSPYQLAAARFRLDELRRTTPGVVSVAQEKTLAPPADGQVAALQREIATFRADNEKLNNALTAAAKEMDGARKAFEVADQRARRAETDLSASRSRVAELVDANQKLEGQTRAAAVEIADAAQTKTALATAQLHLQESEGSLADLQRDRDVQAKSLAAAQTAAASRVGETTRQFAELQRQLQQAREESADLHKQNQSLRETSQSLERHSAETADAVRQLAEAKTTIEQLKHDNADLEARRAALAVRIAQIAPTAVAVTPAAVASTGASTVDEVARLKEDLRRAESKVEMTVRSFELAQQENERLKTQIAQAGASTIQKQDLDAALAEARQTLEMTRAEADKTSAELATQGATLRQLQAANASLAAENALLKTPVSVAAVDRPVGSITRAGQATTITRSVANLPPVSPPPPTAAPRTHRVVSGDTLTRISNKYYGTASRWQEIYTANRDKLSSADVLPLNVELNIP